MPPLLSKPGDMTGETFKVPGEYWGTACPAADREKMFVVAIQEFSFCYRETPAATPGQAYLLREQGEDGHGGASVDFWMRYPLPFLKYWYQSHPEKLDAVVAPKSAASNAQPIELDAEAQADREKTSIAWNYLKVLSSEKIVSGKQRGRIRTKCICTIVEGGKPCNRPVTIYGGSTGPQFKHVRRLARKQGNSGHAEVLLVLNESSCRQVQLPTGEWVPVFNFEQSFPHHLAFTWLVAGGLAMRMNRRPIFIEYVRGFEPRAVMPHNETVHRIVECVDDLQQEDSNLRIQKLLKEMSNLPCVGGQLDMWTDRNTGICYAAFHLTTTAVTDDALELHDDLLAFEAFPFTAHTAQNIKNWLISLAQRRNIPLSAYAGLTPDGAADGCAAIRSIPQWQHLLDKCSLHQLQRSLKYALGLAGTKANCRNPAARDLLGQHKRVVQLSNQSREISDGLRSEQKSANIPLNRILTTVRTNDTRWGNQKAQVTRNCVMKPILDSVLSKYKREHVGETALLETEHDDYDSDGEVVRSQYAPLVSQITRRDVGLSSDMWDASLELEAFMDRPFNIKELIEKCPYITGAQCIFVMLSLKAANRSNLDLQILSLPASSKLEDRKRSSCLMKSDSIHPMIVAARSEIVTQLDARFFQDMPSETRLVQLYMSKQADMSILLPPEWVASAKGFYLVWMRKAATALNLGTRISPPRPKKRSRTSYLFDGLEGGVTNSPAGPEIVAESGAGSDVVQIEVVRWAAFPAAKIEPFRDPASGLVNEFKLMFSVRKEFPLNFFVFRQTCVHIGHEANAEDTFSLSGSLSNENGHTGIDFLSRLTRIQKNKERYKPLSKAVLDKYLGKFSKPKEGEDVEDVPESDNEGSSDEEDDEAVEGEAGPP